MTTSSDLHPRQCPPPSRSRRGRALFGLLAVMLGIGAAAACSSDGAQKSRAGTTADGGDQGSGGGTAADSGSATDSGGDGTAALCDTFFDALAKCPTAAMYLDDRGFFPSGLDKLPKSETDRLRTLYRAHCTKRAALPGTGFDQTSVGACLAAIDKEGCEVTPTTRAACTFKGTLPAGSVCVVAEQCGDLDCFSPSNCGGGALGPFGASPSCGVCRKAPAVGDACDSSQSCGPNAMCVVADPIKSPTGVCTATTVRAAGKACGAPTDLCADGLYCDLPSPFSSAATSTCKALLGEGEACSSPGACKAPLFCSLGLGVGQSGKCQAQPVATSGAAGAGCLSDSDCAADLGCVLQLSSGPVAGGSPGKCQAVTFAEPGAACDASTRCRVGSCPGTLTAGEDGGFPTYSPAGTCPKLIADGQACADMPPVTPFPGGGRDSVCDAFSTCVSGKCTPAAYPTCDAAAAANAPLKCPDPILVACPSAAPTDGDACPHPTPSAGQSVIYPGDCSYDSEKTKCGCVPSMDGSMAWACETCPAAQPTPGDSCGSTGPKGAFSGVTIQCVYADVTCGCGGFGPNGSSWACGSCPATAPKSGDACDLPQGMECDFGAAKCTCSFGPPMAGPPAATTWMCQ